MAREEAFLVVVCIYKPAGDTRGAVTTDLAGAGMILSPSHGDTAFTVPLFDECMRRIMPGEDWRESILRWWFKDKEISLWVPNAFRIHSARSELARSSELGWVRVAIPPLHGYAGSSRTTSG